MLVKVANELDVDSIDIIMYSWLLKHPSNIIPIIGSGKIERIKRGVAALNIDMSLKQWYKIYNAVTGVEFP